MTIGSTIDFYDYSIEQITSLLQRGMVLTYSTDYTLYYLPGTGPAYNERSRIGVDLMSTLRATCSGRQHFSCTITRPPTTIYRRHICA